MGSNLELDIENGEQLIGYLKTQQLVGENETITAQMLAGGDQRS